MRFHHIHFSIFRLEIIKPFTVSANLAKDSRCHEFFHLIPIPRNANISSGVKMKYVYFLPYLDNRYEPLVNYIYTLCMLSGR